MLSGSCPIYFRSDNFSPWSVPRRSAFLEARFFHKCDETSEKVVRVLRSGTGLGMELHAEDRPVDETQAF